MMAVRRLLRASLALALVGTFTVACGLPRQTGVEIEGSAPGAAAADTGQPPVPPGPDEAEDPQELVRFFLQAAAGDPVNAAEEVRPFIHSSQQADWQPRDPQVWVVRAEEPAFTHVSGGERVELTVHPLGVLTNGMVVPREGGRPLEFTFQVVTDPPALNEPGVEANRPRYRILDPPDIVLLDQIALSERGVMRPTSIYLWDADSRVLVPDLRWLPTALPLAQRTRAKLEWLIDGPAPWLGSLSGLPGDLELEGNPVWRDDRLDVTLTAPEAVEPDLARRIEAQVWWTLRDEELPDSHTIGLTINGELREVVGDAGLTSMIRYREPESYVLLGDQAVPYPPEEGRSPLEFAIATAAQSMALTGEGPQTALAMVHPGEDDLVNLTVATTDGTIATDLHAAAMSRPVWLNQPPGVGLVAADGQLYRFSSADAGVQPVDVPGLAGGSTALAVAPDGRRLAMVAGGDLYVASLVRRDDGSVSVNQPRRLETIADDLSGVAFIQENRLAIIGHDGDRSVIYEISVDGAYETEVYQLGAPLAVSNLVGFFRDPHGVNPRGWLMYEFEGQTFRYDYGRGQSPISAGDVSREPPPDGVGPRAPFFAE